MNNDTTWEERFDEKFVVEMPYKTPEGLVLDCLCSNPEHKRIINPGAEPNEIKSFIRTLLAEKEKEAYWKGIDVMNKEIERATPEIKAEALASYRQSLREKVEKMVITDDGQDDKEQWNCAVKAFLSLLNEPPKGI